MFKGMKSLVAAAGVAGVIAGASAAQAAPVQINLEGSGNNWQTIESIDFNFGNTLAVGGVTSDVGDNFDVYYQTNVSAINLAGGGTATGIGSTYHLTVVVKFSETKISGSPGSTVAQFGEGTGGDEYFEMWLTPAAGNNLAGTGFGADSGGILLLAGSSVTVDYGIFGVNPVAGLQDFDQVGANDYAGIDSVVGTGSTTVSAEINYVNSAYFRGVNAGDVITLLNGDVQTTAPFGLIDPSQQFWDANLNAYVNPNIGSTNGLSGPDFQFRTNGGIAFEVTNTPVVPEPATAAMGLFGLAGLAMAARRRR